MKDVDSGELINNLMKFIDHEGEITFKDSNPMYCCIRYKHITKHSIFYLEASSHAMGNGNFELIIKEDKKTVFKATGSYTARPFNIVIHKHISPNKWEKALSKW